MSIVALNLGPTALGAEGIRPVSAWEADFQSVYGPDHTNLYNRLSLSRDSWDHYNLAYGFDGVLAMFLATGNTAYLDRCLLYANNVRATAASSTSLGSGAYRDGFKGWVSQRSDVKGREVPLFELFLWRHVVRMLRIIHDTPALAAQYAGQYSSLLGFVETHIWDKWWSRDSRNLTATPPQGGSYAFYRSVTNIASHAAWTALNLKPLTGSSARRTNCQAVKDNIDFRGFPAWAADGPPGANLRAQLGLMPMPGDPAAYNWCCWWGATDAANIQDISHAGAEVAYIMDCWERGGQYWAETDVRKFQKTFTDHILTADNRHTSNVDGTGGIGGYIADGFIQFGRHDAAVQQRIQQMPAEADNYGGRTQWYGKAALNARYLLGP